MDLLLDTHVWICSQESPERLGPRTTSKLLDEENALFVSTISTVAMGRLISLDRLRLTLDLSVGVERSLELLSATTREISHEVAIEAYRLPEAFHRDPADRLLIGTARIHGLRLVTADERILEYRSVQTLDART